MAGYNIRDIQKKKKSQRSLPRSRPSVTCREIKEGVGRLRAKLDVFHGLVRGQTSVLCHPKVSVQIKLNMDQLKCLCIKRYLHQIYNVSGINHFFRV